MSLCWGMGKLTCDKYSKSNRGVGNTGTLGCLALNQVALAAPWASSRTESGCHARGGGPW
jgi:hypothetical protein